MKKFDMSKYFEAMKLFKEYPVGKTFYMLNDNKIKPVLIYESMFKYNDPFPDKHDSYTLNIQVRLTGKVNNNLKTVFPDELYETREQAAEAFLEKNDIPKKLVEVLNPPKSRTTVGDLIEKLQIIDPAIDLGLKGFTQALKPITNSVEKQTYATHDDFWDCECERKYIHPVIQTQCLKCGALAEFQPSSRIDEIESGEHFYEED
jgi:hypothetical protein